MYEHVLNQVHGVARVQALPTGFMQASAALERFLDKAWGGIQKVPLFSLMFVLPAERSPDFEAATVAGSETIQWLACDSSKPGNCSNSRRYHVETDQTASFIVLFVSSVWFDL